VKKSVVVMNLVGGFLVATALLAWIYLPGEVKKTPLNVDTVTQLEGTAQLGEDTFPVRAESITRADSAKSDGDVISFVNSSCLIRDEGDPPGCVSNDDPQNRLINASTDHFATDRTTAIAVNDPKYLPADAEPHEGLVNKWPFDSEKKDYPYWDGTIGKTVTAAYDGTTTVKGLDVYRYVAKVPPTPVELAAGLQGTYATTQTIYVEPRTGAIVNQRNQQERVGEDGKNFLTVDVSFTDDEIAQSVDDAKSNIFKLDLVTRIVPLVALIIGVPLLLAGLALTFRGGRKETGDRVPEHAA
jgi:Porin PorA